LSFFQSSNKCFISDSFVFHFGQILYNLTSTFAVHCEKRYVPTFFKVCFDHLCDNLESRKRIYCFRKKFGSREFWILKSVQTLKELILPDNLGLKEEPFGLFPFFQQFAWWAINNISLSPFKREVYLYQDYQDLC